ncbi:MAG: hypothetical protein EOO39_43305 [Cytophagaceae bacterium]|nr:MAG: hypothetical protein EOO39_43305 [Cytophagaceae bacterium]
MPKNVIVVEYAEVNYQASEYDGPGTPTNPGQCDTGMPNEIVDGPTMGIIGGPNNTVAGHTWHCTKTAVRYSVRTGAQTITVNATPTASCGISTGNYVRSQVRYQVAGYPVEIGLQGAISVNPDGSGGATVLIGQGLRANLVGGGATFTGLSWSFNDGIPFKSWAASNTSATVNYLTSTDYTALNPLWFYAKNADATVTCSANAMGSNGQSIGVVEAEKKVAIIAPDFTFNGTPGGCNFATDYSDVHAGSANNSVPGIDFLGRTVTPDPFATVHGHGYQQVVQLLNDVVTVDSFTLGDNWNPSSTNGTYWLDNAYPYPFGGGPNNCATPSSSPNSGRILPSDSPKESVDVYTKRIHIVDLFKTYLMYQPPKGYG